MTAMSLASSRGASLRAYAQQCMHHRSFFMWKYSTLAPVCAILARYELRPQPNCLAFRPQIQTKTVSVSLGGRQVLDVQNVLYRGPRDIYLGLGGSVVSTVGVGALYFATYQAVKGTIDERLPHASSLSHMLAASAGALVSALVRVPGDTLKHRVQAYFYPNCWDAARTIVAAEGVRGLYKGFGATLIRDVPEIAIQFTAYEAMRRFVVKHRGQEKLPTYEHLVLGGIAGSLAASCTMPLDYIKTVVQCGRPDPLHKLVATTIAAEGVGGLFKGMGQRVLMTTIMSAAFFGLFEFWKNVLKSEEFREGMDKRLIPKMLVKERARVSGGTYWGAGGADAKRAG